MTTVVVRTSLSQPKPVGAVLLDWFPNDRAASTIQGPAALTDGASSLATLDLLRVAAGVFCADKVVGRYATANGWTRDLTLHVPVSDPEMWTNATALPEAVSFLTGDRWRFEFSAGGHPSAPFRDPDVNVVSLFSGGLDSLAGAIDTLAGDPDIRVGLVSHSEGAGVVPGVQDRLAKELRGAFGDRIFEYPVFIRPAPKRATQHRPLPGVLERSTRGRSLLFIAAGLAVASSNGDLVPMMVPENGFIGINVPLTRARVGSLSTRTTHPYFIHQMNSLFVQTGVTNPLQNPFRTRTKGEILAESKDPDLLRKLAPLSVSCAHPEAARWAQRQQGNCGYCYPCLIRRASMHHVGLDDPHHYAWDALTDPAMWTRSKRGSDLKALISAVRSGIEPIDVLRNGPVPGEAATFAGVWGRGLKEIAALFKDKAAGRAANL